MKKQMTLDDALSISIKNMESRYAEYEAMMENSSDYSLADEMQELKQAADILRNMAEEPVEKKDTVDCAKCITCGTLHDFDDGCEKCGFHSCFLETVYGATKTYNSNRVLKIVEQKTDVKFEEVD